ncbi:MAG: CocE/NonD family hydrolase [Gammaproteobacteria bacterium]
MRPAARLLMALTLLVSVAQAAEPDPLGDFTISEAFVPMRDGVRLYTEIYTPGKVTTPLPILLNRTSYGATDTARPANGVSVFAGPLRTLAQDGYIFVFQDIRGRYRSEGRFVLGRPLRDRTQPGSVDETTDAYDTITWLLAHVPGHNGRVGMHGVSYPGWLTLMAAVEPHPALRAISPQAPPADIYVGDDHFHNGAFRLSYGFEYVALVDRGKENTPFRFDKPDTFDWYLHMGPLADARRRYFGGERTMWSDFIAHPNYDAYWKGHAAAPKLPPITVPTLSVGGWFDQEDGYGPLKVFETLEAHDGRGINHLVVGPWNHGGWMRTDGRSLGAVDFGSATAEYFRSDILVPWFAYYLKDRGAKPPKVRVFQTGGNVWESVDSWPRGAGGVEARKLYLHSRGALSFATPTETGAQAADRYLSDPRNPVPYRARPIEPTFDAHGSSQGWRNWLGQDQRFVQARPDVLSWTSEPLRQDLVIRGPIAAHLFAATTGSDADWIVKLIDVYPQSGAPSPALAGYEFMVAADVLRGRFRQGLEQPHAIEPGRVNEYVVPLSSRNHRFLAGHRLMVQVQSTWFPLIDRNPQTYVPNIFLARESDFKAATHSIYRSAEFPSYVALDVVTP